MAFVRECVPNGCVVMCPKYRLGAHGRPSYPKVMDDIEEAVHDVQKIRGVSRVVLVGLSAGGHLALLYGLQHPDDVDGVVSVSGIGDLHSVQATIAEGIEALLGRNPNDQLLIEASPISYALPDGPPVLILHGARDELVPVASARALADALGGRCRLVVIDGGHVEPMRANILQEPLREFVAELKSRTKRAGRI